MGTYLDELSKSLASTTSQMSDEALLRAPEGKWCVAEILEHLRLTYTGTAKMLEKNRDKPPIEETPISEQMRAARQRIFEQRRFFEGLQAPPFATPKTPPDPQVRLRVQEDLRRLSLALDEAEARLGKDTPLGNHFALGPLTGEQWRHFHYEHGMHHVKQIEGLRSQSAEA